MVVNSDASRHALDTTGMLIRLGHFFDGSAPHFQMELRGSADEKKNYYSRVKQKIISMYSHPKFVSRLFLNVKKTNCIKNIRF